MTIPKTIKEVESALVEPKPFLFQTLNMYLDVKVLFNLYKSIYIWMVEKEEKPSETSIENDFLRVLGKARNDLFINCIVSEKEEKFIIFNVNDVKRDITRNPLQEYYKVYNFEDNTLGTLVFITTLEILFGYNMLKEDNGLYMKKEDIIRICDFFYKGFANCDYSC